MTFVKIRSTADKAVPIPTILNSEITKVTGCCLSKRSRVKSGERSREGDSSLHRRGD